MEDEKKTLLVYLGNSSSSSYPESFNLMPLAFLIHSFYYQIATSTFSYSFNKPNPQAVVVVVRALVVIARV